MDAVVAVEDHRFEQHWGIDLIAIGRAAWNNLISWSLREGGSTITQQLAKNMYFTQEKSFIRKIAEMFMAFRLENTYTKDKILELYVNSIYFGDGYYCVRDASRGYFGKEPIDMTGYESTLLAGIPNAPSVAALMMAGVMTLSLCACNSTTPDASDANADPVSITTTESWDFSTGFYPAMSPATSNGTYGFTYYARNCYDTLVVREDGEFKAGLAETWDISDDGLTYTFHLKEGVNFRNRFPEEIYGKL